MSAPSAPPVTARKPPPGLTKPDPEVKPPPGLRSPQRTGNAPPGLRHPSPHASPKAPPRGPAELIRSPTADGNGETLRIAIEGTQKELCAVVSAAGDVNFSYPPNFDGGTPGAEAAMARMMAALQMVMAERGVAPSAVGVAGAGGQSPAKASNHTAKPTAGASPSKRTAAQDLALQNQLNERLNQALSTKQAVAKAAPPKRPSVEVDEATLNKRLNDALAKRASASSAPSVSSPSSKEAMNVAAESFVPDVYAPTPSAE